jgi:hypothetical protein
VRAAALIVLMAGCLGGGGGDAPDGGAVELGASDDSGGVTPSNDDGGGGPPTPLDSGMAPGMSDLAALDLAGLTNCYGVAICDPGSSFCIRYFAGSQATPGNAAGGPACYQPSDTCANQGQPMNCSCIQADSNLGPSCQGSCVDHNDGTYDCYAK